MVGIRGETMDNYKLQHMEIDLNNPIAEKNVGMVMGSGDELANTFTVSVKRGGETVDLAGCTVTGYLIMPNDETLRITGSVKDGKASVTVPKSGYVYDGAFQLAIKTVVSGKENTVAIFVGQNARTTTESISDGQRVVYGVKDILNMIDSMDQAEKDAKAAATSANNAAASANSAASKANTATSNANAATTAAQNAVQAATTAAGNANAATTNANNAAGAANQAAGRAENVASKSPYIGDNGNWYVYDVAHGAYVDSGLPSRGIPGEGAVSTVNGKQPDAEGNVKLGAVDVGALATADILNTLYPVGIIVPFANAVEPAAIWGGTWELLAEGRTLIKSGSEYALGSTGGEASHKLTTNEMPNHTHNIFDMSWAHSSDISYTMGADNGFFWVYDSRHTAPIKSSYVTTTGGSLPHNNMPPYLAVNLWKRTA